jgi:hypothetical protein
MYRITWDTFTNIGIDVAGAALGLFLPIQIVGRVLVAAATVLAPLGGVLLWRELHGRWHWWQISFPLLAWGLGLVFGFLNFQIGLGLALLAAAVDPVLGRRGRWIQSVGRVVLSAILLLVHIFAIPFYAVLLAGMAFGPQFKGLAQTQRIRRLAKALLWIGATVVLPVLVLLSVAPRLPGAQVNMTLQTIEADFSRGFVTALAHPIGKLRALASGIRAYSIWADLMTLTALALPVAMSLACRKLVVHAGMLTAGFVLITAYLGFPTILGQTADMDTRFALMVPLILATSLCPTLSPSMERIAGTVLLAISLLRTGNVAWIWHLRQADVAAVFRAIQSVPPGAALLPLQHRVAAATGGPPGRYLSIGVGTYGHLVTLALPDRLAFVPTLFTARGKQPVEVRPPWNEIVHPDGGIIASVHVLDSSVVLRESLSLAPYLRSWQDRFDFILVVNADLPDDTGPFMPPVGVTLVRDEGFAQLYRIDTGVARSMPSP